MRIHLILALSCTPLLADWSLRPGPEGVEVLEDGKPLTRYELWQYPCIHPLPSPSGANLARYWPMVEGIEGEETDHPHHRGLWMTHGDVNGHDFWHGRNGERIRQVALEDLEQGADGAGFTARLEWAVGDEVLLREERRHRFFRPDARSLAIEVTSRLEATDRDVVFGDTKEGTFAVRVDRSLRHEGPLARGHIANSEGQRDGDCWGKRARWTAFFGPDEKDEPAVVAILDHPDNLRHPTWWHARSYGLLAANPFGVHHFENREDPQAGAHTIPAGGELEQRYLVLLHHGDLESASLEERWRNFAGKPQP